MYNYTCSYSLATFLMSFRIFFNSFVYINFSSHINITIELWLALNQALFPVGMHTWVQGYRLGSGTFHDIIIMMVSQVFSFLSAK